VWRRFLGFCFLRYHNSKNVSGSNPARQERGNVAKENKYATKIFEKNEAHGRHDFTAMTAYQRRAHSDNRRYSFF
jgi:hypothetical protein